MARRRTTARPKDPYERIARSAVGVVLFLAVCAWVLHVVAAGLAALIGTDLPSVWEAAGAAFGVDEATVRLVLFLALHAAIVGTARRPLALAATRLDRFAIDLRARVGKTRNAVLNNVLAGSCAVVTAAVIVAFVLQPTLVPLRVDGHAWLLRAANLVDGTASASIVDSVVGLVRRFTADPVEPSIVVDASAFDAEITSDVIPLMDRWDPWLLAAAEGDRELFAQTKAFMWVESGGRQFALSSTGCAGLMQFCASTAQRRPFGSIFGVGAVAACGCDDCSVPRAVQIALETDPGAAEVHADTFPCNLADARFDAELSIRAGVAFVRELSEGVGGQLPLMYIGYNAGPRVAESLYETLRADAEISVDDLRPHLADALRPYHGTRAEPRANGLLEVHLPKLLEAYERFREP
jgi:hypothetical protein